MSNRSFFNKPDQDKFLNSEYTNELSNFRIESSEEKIDTSFFNSIRNINNRIISDIGDGANSLNDLTIVAIAKAFCKIDDPYKKEEKKIFLISDSKMKSQMFLNIFARVLTENNYKIFSIDESYHAPLNIQKYASIRNKCEIIVTFQSCNGDDKKMQILFNNKNGSPFDDEKMQKIMSEMSRTNLLEINLPELPAKINYDLSHLNYINEIVEHYKDNKYLGEKFIKFGIDFSDASSYDFFTSGFDKLKLNYFSKKRNKDSNYYHVDNQKYLMPIYWKGLFKGSKANFVINQQCTGINLCIKHKSVFKFFKSDELAAIYLHFLINEDLKLTKEELSRFIIAKNSYVGSLTKKIAEINGIQTYDFINKSTIHDIVKKTNKKLLFAFTASNEFLSHNSINKNFDGYQFLFEILRMINYYKVEKNKDLFDILKEIYQTYGQHQLCVKSYEMNFDSAKRFIQRIKQVEKISDKYKIVRFQELSNIDNLYNVYQLSFQNKESTYIKYNQALNSIQIYCETLENKKEDNRELTMVVRNHEIVNGLVDLKEDNQESKVSKKSIIKFSFYFAIFAAIILFLFYTVYKIDDGNNDGPIAVMSAIIKKLYVRFDAPGNSRHVNDGYLARAAFAFMCLSFLAVAIIQAWVFKKLIKLQGGKVKWRDVFTGSAIGLIIQTLTPKSIGGDLATYWYLRRRDVSRPIMMSSIVVNTFIWQITNIISTIIFVPMGVAAYKNFFSGDNPIVAFFIIMLILGLIFDTGLAIILLVMTVSIKVQNFLIKIIVLMAEWLPFIKSYDPFAIKAKFKYEMFNIRQCMKKTFKNPWHFIEMVIIKMIPLLISPTALQAKSLDIVKPDIQYGYYINMTVQSTLTRVANAISLTPGGTGTSDFLYKSIVLDSIQSTAYDGKNQYSNAGIITAMSTLGTVIIASLVSAILLMLVYIGERRVDYYKKKTKNLKLLMNNNLNKKIKTTTKYYKISFSLFYLAIIVLTPIFIFVG
ncbi:flippase-like domain-containing protein [Mycoplasma tauri]|uniref:lysylphosphatidylglycerol synthase domain-containing protein n=1 Tax=Mycoplasma tauri TaxID=547987 RepID=UPI0019678259|nr:lysylphosphatidylglycerol synthase domain-containing protein [Mycoplasma tauri]QSB07411.1 flippase-like domain-containing protein [Mycoplasma tauri]